MISTSGLDGRPRACGGGAGRGGDGGYGCEQVPGHLLSRAAQSTAPARIPRAAPRTKGGWRSPRWLGAPGSRAARDQRDELEQRRARHAVEDRRVSQRRPRQPAAPAAPSCPARQRGPARTPPPPSPRRAEPRRDRRASSRRSARAAPRAAGRRRAAPPGTPAARPRRAPSRPSGSRARNASGITSAPSSEASIVIRGRPTAFSAGANRMCSVIAGIASASIETSGAIAVHFGAEHHVDRVAAPPPRGRSRAGRSPA